MSKENALDFLQKAAEDESLKSQLQAADDQHDVVSLGKAHGYEFSSENLKDVIPEIQQKKGFFGDLAESIIRVFSPAKDDYPMTGVQPFSGDPNRGH